MTASRPVRVIVDATGAARRPSRRLTWFVLVLAVALLAAGAIALTLY